MTGGPCQIETNAHFVQDEFGGSSNLGLFVTLFCLLMSGIMLDTANGWRIHSQLQVTTDVATLAASQHLDDPALARQIAIQVAELNMSSASLGAPVIQEQDITFGHWDAD